MASIVERGTRANPRYYAKWVVGEGTAIIGADGQPVINPKTGKPKLKYEVRWRLLPGVTTLKDARAALPDLEKAVHAGVREPLAKTPEPESVGALLEKWAESLTNRNAANDRTIIRLHLIPRFGRMTLGEITVKEVITWLDDMKNEKKHSGQTQAHALKTLSRFWGWSIIRGHTAAANPCKSVPEGGRPIVKHAKRATLEDERKVAELIAALPAPVGLMFALANRTGMRLGEVCGLRMSDLDYLNKGFILVGRSYGGPRKEDKHGDMEPKPVPAPVDARKALAAHLAQRRKQGAGPDGLVFIPTKKPNLTRKSGWAGFRKENIRDYWRNACQAVGLVDADRLPTVGWYGATRTTQATRGAKADVSLEQIADSLGHASATMTRRHYAHFQRTHFDRKLRLPMLPVLRPAAKKVRAAKAK